MRWPSSQQAGGVSSQLTSDNFCDKFWTHIVCGAPCGGPVALVRDEHVFQQLTPDASLIPRLNIYTAFGSPISSIDWTFRGLVALQWVTTDGSKSGGFGSSPSDQLALEDENSGTNALAVSSASSSSASQTGPTWVGPFSQDGNSSKAGSASAAQCQEGEKLCAVFEDGTVRLFSVFCELLQVFTIDERCKAEKVLLLT